MSTSVRLGSLPPASRWSKSVPSHPDDHMGLPSHPDHHMGPPLPMPSQCEFCGVNPEFILQFLRIAAFAESDSRFLNNSLCELCHSVSYQHLWASAFLCSDSSIYYIRLNLSFMGKKYLWIHLLKQGFFSPNTLGLEINAFSVAEICCHCTTKLKPLLWLAFSPCLSLQAGVNQVSFCATSTDRPPSILVEDQKLPLQICHLAFTCGVLLSLWKKEKLPKHNVAPSLEINSFPKKCFRARKPFWIRLLPVCFSYWSLSFPFAETSRDRERFKNVCILPQEAVLKMFLRTSKEP